MIVADASALIALTKMERLPLLKQVYGGVLIGPLVKAETVDAGKRISAPGARQIENAIDDGWIQVGRLSPKEKKLMQSILEKSRLDDGESECIALASSRRLPVILDDKEARSFAEALGSVFFGTAAVLLHGLISKHLTLGELEEAVQELSNTIWLAPAVVAKILKAGREVKK